MTRRLKSLSLHPLHFEEAVKDILKIKPERKPPKKREKPQPAPSSGSPAKSSQQKGR